MSFKITSTAFEYEGSIPIDYTCDGADVSPPLCWCGVPEGTRSLALLVDDPDAPDPDSPTMVWVHWILYDLPADSEGLAEAITDDALPAGTRQGINDWKRTGYGGPCPPIGRHRYFFKLFALDIELTDLDKPTAEALKKSMKRHILAETSLMGTYARS